MIEINSMRKSIKITLIIVSLFALFYVVAIKSSNEVEKTFAILNKKTQQAIYEILENWDFVELGQITQKLVISISKFSRSRVQRHWFHFKDYVEDLNNEYIRKSA